MVAIRRDVVMSAILFIFLSIATAQDLLSNPGFEGDYSGRAPNWSNNLWSGATVEYNKETNITRSGSASQKMKVTSFGTNGGAMLYQPVSLDINQLYTGSIWLRADSPTAVKVYTRANDSSAPYSYHISGGRYVSVGTNWTQVTFQIAAQFPDSEVPHRICIIPTEENVAIYLDDASITNVTADHSSFDLSSQLPVDSDYFGLHINKGHEGIWPSIQQGLIRLWDTGTTWEKLEPSQDSWNWARFDLYMNLIQNNAPDCRILYTFGIIPPWARSDGNTRKPPDNIEDWNNYVTEVVTRYLGKIHYYEIWNEVDYSGFYQGTKDELIALASNTYTIIKSIDPSAIVLTPNFTHAGLLYMDEYLERGGWQYADAVAVHNYFSVDDPGKDLLQLLCAKDLITQHGLNLPMLTTEGAPTIPVNQTPSDSESRSAVARGYLLNRLFGSDMLAYYFWEPTPWESANIIDNFEFEESYINGLASCWYNNPWCGAQVIYEQETNHVFSGFSCQKMTMTTQGVDGGIHLYQEHTLETDMEYKMRFYLRSDSPTTVKAGIRYQDGGVYYQLSNTVVNVGTNWAETTIILPPTPEPTTYRFYIRPLEVNIAVYIDDANLLYQQRVPLSKDDHITVRPGGIAYETLTSWMTGARILNGELNYTNGITKIELDRGNGYKGYILWRNTGTATFTLPSEWHIATIKYLNGTEDLVTNNSVQIGIEPVLFETDPCVLPNKTAHWKFDSTGWDSSRFMQDAALTDASYVLGRYGNALQLKGTVTSYAKVSSSNMICPAHDMTISFWFNKTSEQTNMSPSFVRKSDFSCKQGYCVYMASQNELAFRLYDGSSYGWLNAEIKTQTSGETGVWTHVAAVLNEQEMRLYLDGRCVATKILNSPYTVDYGNQDLLIGQYFNGVMDDVRIYNYALSDEEISTLRALVSWWPFDNGLAADCAEQNTGTIGIGITSTNGIFGDALSFPGTSACVTIPPSASLAPTNEMTISLWMNSSKTFLNTGETINSLFCKANWISKEGLTLFGDDNGQLTLRLYDGSDYGWVGNSISANYNRTTDWDHVVVTYNNSISRIYINGTLAQESLSSGFIPYNGDLKIGVYFNGLIDDIRFYNQALSTHQVEDLFFNESY